MAENRISFEEYSRLFEKGEIAPSGSYIIDGDVTLSSDGCNVLLGVTVRGSVTVCADTYDSAIVKCKIDGDIVSNASSVIIKDCEARSVRLESGSANVLVACNRLETLTVKEGYNCSVLLNSACAFSVKGGKNIYVVENTVSGSISLCSVNYLLCDGNVAGNVV